MEWADCMVGYLKGMKFNPRGRKIHACSVLCSFYCSIKSHISPQVRTGSWILFEAFLLIQSIASFQRWRYSQSSLTGKSLKPTITSKANLSKFVSEAWKLIISCQELLLAYGVSCGQILPRGLRKRFGSGWLIVARYGRVAGSHMTCGLQDYECFKKGSSLKVCLLWLLFIDWSR
jgi:hypothetical protein